MQIWNNQLFADNLIVSFYIMSKKEYLLRGMKFRKRSSSIQWWWIDNCMVKGANGQCYFPVKIIIPKNWPMAWYITWFTVSYCMSLLHNYQYFELCTLNDWNCVFLFYFLYRLCFDLNVNRFILNLVPILTDINA